METITLNLDYEQHLSWIAIEQEMADIEMLESEGIYIVDETN